MTDLAGEYDVIVIGTGPGGEGAAIRLRREVAQECTIMRDKEHGRSMSTLEVLHQS